MAYWRVKDLSKLTGVSVRTLHHYDAIGLLKPSMRQDNNYRVYTESDVLKLEQIVALKFFGFQLKEIKAIMASDTGTPTHLQMQKKCLQRRMKTLQQAEKCLDTALAQLETNTSVDYKNILRLMEVFRMVDEMKKTWLGEAYTDAELKQFVEARSRYSQEEMDAYHKKWEDLIAEVERNLDKDPTGDVGKRLAKAWVELVDEAWGQHPHLKKIIGEAYKQEKIPMSPTFKKVRAWIENAKKAL